MYKVLAVCLLAGSLSIGWLWLDLQAFLERPLVIGSNANHYVVKPGDHLTGIAHDLARQGILDKPRYFVWYARIQGQANRIKVGEYRLEPGMTAAELLRRLTQGQVIQYALTLVEGWNFQQVMQAVNNDPNLIHHLEGLDNATIMGRLGYPGIHPEGRFFPDTYHFPRGLTDIEFLQRAYRAMQKTLEAEWQKRDIGLPFNTPYEALIMASIVEKETGLREERQAIAGVFVRRLNKGMRLQSDPTVIYGMGDSYQGNIRRKDLLRKTPYNTYRQAGLPPTPIAMPGRDAIHATLHPLEGKTLYFVSRGDGSHHFSATLEEHNRAVIKYQLKGRKRAFSSFQPDKDSE